MKFQTQYRKTTKDMIQRVHLSILKYFILFNTSKKRVKNFDLKYLFFYKIRLQKTWYVAVTDYSFKTFSSSESKNFLNLFKSALSYQHFIIIYIFYETLTLLTESEKDVWW